MFAMLEQGTGSGGGNDSKHYNMKQFINAVRSYLQTKAEETANLINRLLQLLSVTIDFSVFDPHTNIVSEFFVSLYELLSNLEQRSALAWCCVNVLVVACHNGAARKALTHTYQFLPLLSRLLGDHLSVEKKIRLLTLMQELTCGIKITWQIPHLSHLISTLTHWIESKEEQVVTLSLGVLVNLLYRNLPAVYTLSRCVDIKKMVRTCMPLKGLNTEVHVCKLLLILDDTNGKIPEGAFLKLTEVTFRSVIDAFKVRDAVLLRHIIEFFMDIWQQNNHTDTLLKFENYDGQVVILLQEMQEASTGQSGDNTSNDPECMAVLFKFLHFLLTLQLAKLEPLYPHLVNIALKWTQTEFVRSDALAVLRTVVLNRSEEDSSILEPVLDGLQIFLIEIENSEEEIPTHIENNKRLSALMELLRVLVKAPNTRNKVLAVLKQDLLLKIFTPLVGDKSPRTRASSENTYTPEAVLLYVNTIALIDELVKHDLQWINVHTYLMQQKQIHMVLAQALFGSSKETKALILSMSSNHFFPITEVASSMYALQPLVQVDKQIINNTNQNLSDNLCFPVMSVTQMERLDEIMHKIEEACQQNNLANVATSDVMELYEYKLSTMSHAERAAIWSVEAASQRCTQLQHRTAQLTAELSRLHQLLLHTQQCQEDCTKSKNAAIEKIKQLQEWLDSEKSRYSSTLVIKERMLNEKTQLIEETTRKLKEIENEKHALDEKHNDLKRVVSKMEENLIKKEKLVEKKEEQISRLNLSSEHQKMQISQLEKQALHLNAELSSKSKELAETNKELTNCKQILGTITQLTTSQYTK